MARARLARATSSWSAPDSKPDPSGFCTLTCSVYKWAQLHTTLLKAYPSGDAATPAFREHYTQWELLPPGAAREIAMKKTYYQLAVRDPGAVAWYCAVKLEMATALTAALLTEQLKSKDVPGLADARQKNRGGAGLAHGPCHLRGRRPGRAPFRPGRRLVRDVRVERGGHHPRSHGLLGGRRPTHRQGRGASPAARFDSLRWLLLDCASTACLAAFRVVSRWLLLALEVAFICPELVLICLQGGFYLPGACVDVFSRWLLFARGFPGWLFFALEVAFICND